MGSCISSNAYIKDICLLSNLKDLVVKHSKEFVKPHLSFTFPLNDWFASIIEDCNILLRNLNDSVTTEFTLNHLFILLTDDSILKELFLFSLFEKVFLRLEKSCFIKNSVINPFKKGSNVSFHSENVFTFNEDEVKHVLKTNWIVFTSSLEDSSLDFTSKDIFCKDMFLLNSSIYSVSKNNSLNLHFDISNVILSYRKTLNPEFKDSFPYFVLFLTKYFKYCNDYNFKCYIASIYLYWVQTNRIYPYSYNFFSKESYSYINISDANVSLLNQSLILKDLVFPRKTFI